ncbi:type I restriction-modification system subunit M [Bifidobacterium stellenboschense]|uniref:site-specific DNA-methyltransferase (adenine-specific) n=1 Tax=Bifidobacterium stellenboschense TaxID=762211 RepID=A0A087DRA0_9BIFI|nr:class I SAM-dependent DNA methyltransferase [Bifidobacterium stellenboschense]KFI98050.1 putative type I restriction-modification system, M subunit N-6 Adenine-specific DNA methylase [Bifidobacterium stellenboschense]
MTDGNDEPREATPAAVANVDVKRQVDAVFSIANNLRGTYQPDKYRDVIIPMTILRRLECALADTRDRVSDLVEQDADTPYKVLCNVSGHSFYNTSRWTLGKLVAEPASLHRNLVTYIDAFSPNIKEIFTDLEFDKEIKKMHAGSKLTGVVRKFSELDLDPKTVNNVAMGYMFEEIIRRFSENAEAGDHYTPREVVRLITRLALAEGCDDFRRKGRNINVGDFACGTGGMLSCAKEQLDEVCPKANIYLFGQEVIPDTHAICLADMLIKGQKGENIRHADTMKEDCFPDERMQLILMNPPFGTPWGGKDAGDGVEAAVTAEHKRLDSRFPAGLPAKSDMQLLFMQHALYKLDDDGRACIISNGSPLFSGGTSSGESQIRRWMLENDYVEAIVGLPGDLFYNTGIGIYVWVLSKHKAPKRKGVVQLIDATGMWEKMRRSMGNKRKYISDGQIDAIVRLYQSFEENDHSHILPCEEFLYKEYAIYQPMRRSYQITEERIRGLIAGKLRDDFHNPAKLEELESIDEADLTAKQRGDLEALRKAETVFDELVTALRANLMDEKTLDWKGFAKRIKAMVADLPDYKTKVTAAQRKSIADKVIDAMSMRDEEAPLREKRDGSIEYDPATKDVEIVKLSEDVESYCEREVYPYVKEAKWFDEETDKAVKTGAEIPFSRYFYHYEEPESSDALLDEFMALERRLDAELKELGA